MKADERRFTSVVEATEYLGGRKFAATYKTYREGHLHGIWQAIDFLKILRETEKKAKHEQGVQWLTFAIDKLEMFRVQQGADSNEEE